jgi:hypothetical protein
MDGGYNQRLGTTLDLSEGSGPDMTERCWVQRLSQIAPLQFHPSSTHALTPKGVDNTNIPSMITKMNVVQRNPKDK